MGSTDTRDWTISILLPEQEPEPGFAPRVPDESVQNQSIQGLVPRFGRVAEIDGRSVQTQWARTVDTLMSLSSTISEHTQDWTIDEIEVGLTLSAKGELLFIAEAGAEGSIKFVLKRKPNGPPTPGV